MNSPPTKPGIPERVWRFVSVHARVLFWVFAYIPAHRAWHLAPLIAVLIVFGLLIFVSSNPTVSPFLYALF